MLGASAQHMIDRSQGGGYLGPSLHCGNHVHWRPRSLSSASVNEVLTPCLGWKQVVRDVACLRRLMPKEQREERQPLVVVLVVAVAPKAVVAKVLGGQTLGRS